MTVDDQGTEQWGGVQYDAQAGQWKAPDEGVFGEDEIDADRGTVSLLGLPLAFFFRPSKFMRSFGVHMPGGLVFAIIWITGISLILMKFEQKIAFGSSSSWFPESWLEISIIAVLGGLLRGAFVFWLGGWWYRVRLGFCGVDNQPWTKTGRVYMSAGIAKHSLYIAIVALGALQHNSYIDYVQNQPANLALIVGVIIVISEIWSSFTLYFGTRSIFSVNKLWAVVWYLVLPIMIRLVALAVLLGFILFSGFAAEPNLDQPTKFVGESFRFEYPSNWYITRDEEVPGPETWFQAEPFIGDAFFEFSVYNVDPSDDIVESVLQNFLDGADMTVNDNPKQLATQGRFEGRGFEYQAILEGSEYLFRLFEFELEEGSHLLITALVEESSWDTLEVGYDRILQTLSITNPSEIEPDLSRTYTVRHELVEFDIPRNWWRDVLEDEDIENEDGTISKGTISILIQPPGYGSFRVIIYESSLSPRAELGITIDDYTTNSRLIDEEPLEEWLGLEGFGVMGKISYDDGTLGTAKFMVSKLPDGRLIEIRKVIPDDVVDFYAPGFDHIESTFNLRIDPSSVPPSPEP